MKRHNIWIGTKCSHCDAGKRVPERSEQVRQACGTHGSFFPSLTCGRHHQSITALFSTEPRPINYRWHFKGHLFGMLGIWHSFEDRQLCELFPGCEFTDQFLNSIHLLKPRSYPIHSREPSLSILMLVFPKFLSFVTDTSWEESRFCGDWNLTTVL